jgi:hypothetical protein
MSRDIFGNKRKLRKEKDFSYQTSEWDVTKEKIKIVILLAVAAVFMYYIILGQGY